MNLKTYIKLGMKLVKIHRVLAFKQSLFLKEYIDQTTNLRASAKSDFEKSLFKLMINANFGKFIERTRDYLQIKLCIKDKSCDKYISNPRFSNMQIISEDLVAVFLKQPTVYLNKAFPIGFTILERSKQFMYEQFYNVIRPKLPQCQVEVLFSDTDSFGLSIKRPLEQNQTTLQQLNSIFDFSNYPKTSPLYSTKNASKLGFFKNELCGGKMREFVGLRSKCYAFLFSEYANSKTSLRNKCKGVTKGYKKTLNFQDFKKCIKTVAKKIIQQYHIRAHTHVVKTLTVEKICFSSFDDKRYLMKCGIHSLAYGSKLIKEAEESDRCVFCNI